MSPVVVAGVFVYGLALSFAADADLELSRQFMFSVLVLGTIYVVRWYRIDFDRVVLICGGAICAVTAVAFAALVLMAGSAGSDQIAALFSQYALGAWGHRELLSDSATMFSLGTVPFLFATFCVLIERIVRRPRVGTVVFLLVVAVVVLASTSRGLVLACLLIAAVGVVRKSSPLMRAVYLAALLVSSLVILPYVIAYTNLFSVDEASNAVKIGHARSFIENLDAWRFVFGQGLGAYYYSSGRGLALAHTEITALDLARYVGVPLAIAVFVALIFPVVRGIRMPGAVGIYVFYFLVYVLLAQTNPVLINSYGLLVVVWYWSHVLAARAASLHFPVRT
jgi:hypothetical protein